MKKPRMVINIIAIIFLLFLCPFILLWYVYVDDKKMFFDLLLTLNDREKVCKRGEYLKEKGYKAYIYDISKDKFYESNLEKYKSNAINSTPTLTYASYYPNKTYITMMIQYYPTPIGDWQKAQNKELETLLNMGFKETDNDYVCEIIKNASKVQPHN
jgi:hypothetical protein